MQVALLAAGALVALVGGAETASWGLTPLTASLNATAPQIVASSASPLDNSAPVAEQTIGELSAASATVDTMPIAYSVSPAPSMDAEADGLLPGNDIHTDAPSPADSASVADLSLGDHEAGPSSGSSAAEPGTPARDAEPVDAPPTGGGTGNTAVAQVGPD